MLYSIVLQQRFLPLNSVQLGRLVLSVDEPQQDYLDPLCDHEDGIIANPQTQYNEVQQTAADKSFSSVLTRLVSASRTKQNKTSTRVATDRVTTYQLNNSGLWFKNAVKLEATRKWIEQAIDQGEDVYVVVGYHTMLNARIVESASMASESSAQFDVPATALLAATGAVIPVGRIADPGISGHQQYSQGVQKQFVATGEQVCAVQYRKVHFKWFSSRDLDSAVLEKENRWKVYWNIRGQESGTNDVLETDLQDELELEGDREKYTSEVECDFFY
ncbi:MAG: hypothetical protein M1813_003518 [Trichoglossum hirsutum]|nr:MAG: hypothetical protein M1813_003518 [Trichoglossum hirsutum]